MADNYNYNETGTRVMAGDDVGPGVLYPRVKVSLGADGSATDCPGDGTNGMDVDVTRLPALPAGTNNIGDVDVASLPTTHSKTADFDTGAGTDTVAMLGLALPASGGAVAGGTATNPVRTDPTGTTTQPVSAASLPLPTGASTLAEQQSQTTALQLIDDVIATDGSAALTKGAQVAGTDGTNAQILKTDAAGELQVDVLTLPALVAGTANIGDVDVLSLPALPAGTNNIGDVDVLSVVPGTGATALGKAEDAVAGSGDTGVVALAVRRDAASPGVDADGDYAALSVDSTGALRVTGGGGGTQFAEDAAHTSGDAGTMALGIRRDADTTPVSADNDYHPFVFDAAGNLKVNIKAGAGSGGTAQADESAFTEGTTSFTPIGGVLNDTITSDPTEDQAAAARITAKRAIHVNLRDASGNEVAVGGGTQYDEDTAHVTADKLTLAGAVRRDTPVSGVDADGDRATLNVNSAGRLYTSTTVDAALPAGTNNIGDVDVLSLPALPAGTNNIGDVDVLSLPALPAGTNNIGDVDVLTLPNVTLAAGTNTNEVVGDAAHDAPSAGNPVLIGGHASAAAPADVSADGDVSRIWTTLKGAVNVADAGGSLTVDGTVAVSTLPALVAGTANIGDVDVLSLPAIPAGNNNIGDVDIATMPNVTLAAGTNTNEVVGDAAHDAAVAGNPVLVGGYGSTATPTAVSADGDATRIWTTLTGAVNVADAGGSLTVDGTVSVNALPAGTNNIGDVDIVSLPNEGQQTMANSISVAIASDQSTLVVGGTVAHDAADAGNPQKIGAKAIAHGTNPTAVAAADRTDLYANRAGVQFVIGGHPNVVTTRVNYTAAQTDTAIVTVGAGLKIVVTRVLVAVSNATTTSPSVLIGFGTTTTPTGAGVVADHPGIPAGGGFNTGDGSGILGVGADNEDLRITSSVPTTGSLSVTVSYYTIES